MAGATIELNVPYRSLGRDQSKSFTISFVSNWATKQFKELTEDSIKGFKEVMQLKAGEKTLDQLDTAIISKFETLLERKYEIIKDILESNGYEYDFKFWDRHCDPNAVNDFIKDAVHKDVSGSMQKKTVVQ